MKKHSSPLSFTNFTSCKTTVKLVTRGAPKNQTTSREVKFVNEKGEECFFIAKVVDSK